MGDLFGGGRKIVEYRYFANFAVAFEGPAGGVLRIWAGDRLIADLRQGAGAYANHPKYRFRIYLGSEDQESDRLIRQHVENSNDFDGHDATPAFRGLVYIVFDNLPLDEFGNRIPPITAEIAWTQVDEQPILATSSIPGGVFTADVWYYLEVEAFVHDTTGFVRVYRDGNLLVEAMSADTRGQAGTDLVEMIRFHGNTGGGTSDGPNVVNIDDIYLLDDSTRLGQCRVSTLLPNTDTADADWTPLGAGSHFAEVDDDNGDTSYIASDNRAGCGGPPRP